MARTPMAMGSVMRLRFIGSGHVAVDRPVLEVGDVVERRAAVDGAAEAVEDAAEQPPAAPDRERLAGGDDLAVRADAARLAERHEHDRLVAEADHLADDAVAAAGVDVAHLADAHARHHGLDDEAGDLGDAAAHVDGLGLLDRLEVLAEIDERRVPPCSRPATSACRSHVLPPRR